MEEKRMATIGIFYGSTTGNTQSVAEKIQADFGGRETADLCSISDASIDALNSYQYLLLGSSTLGDRRITG